MMSGAILGFSMVWIFLALYSYVIDSYLRLAASALAALRAAVAAQTPSGGARVLWVNESTSSLPLAWAHLRPERPGSMLASGASGLGYALGGCVGAVLGARAVGAEHELVAAVVGVFVVFVVVVHEWPPD